MKKNNPLFVDSTKFHGDTVATEVELTKLLLFEGEEVFINILDGQQVVQKQKLIYESESQIYKVCVWLNYQKVIKYFFSIEQENNIVFKTQERSTKATYLIKDEWAPMQIPIDLSDKELLHANKSMEFLSQHQIQDKRFERRSPLNTALEIFEQFF